MQSIQIPGLSVFFMVISVILIFGLPVTLFVVCRKKAGAKVIPLMAGIAGFVVFALVLEGMIHNLVLGRTALRANPAAFAVYGIFMAGIFEESARFIAFHILKKKFHTIGTGLAYGIGHGGIEAILLAGLATINSLAASIMVNTGNIATLTGNLEGAVLEQAQAQINALASTAPPMFLVGGLERVFAIGIQLALSVIVFYGVCGKKSWWLYPLAILAHAAIDLPAVLMQIGVIQNVVVVEVLVGLCSIALLLAARYVHRRLRVA
jgi:uncharacterized membrane protein YhfC